MEVRKPGSVQGSPYLGSSRYAGSTPQAVPTESAIISGKQPAKASEHVVPAGFSKKSRFEISAHSSSSPNGGKPGFGPENMPSTAYQFYIGSQIGL